MNKWRKYASVSLAVCLIGLMPMQTLAAELVDGPNAGGESTETVTGVEPPSGSGSGTQPGTETGTQPGMAPGVQTDTENGTQVPPGVNNSAQPGGPAGGRTGTSSGASGQGTSGTSETSGPAGGNAGGLLSNVTKPEIAAEGAVLMDAATGTVLYEKNADKAYYPASITKLMTALLVIENCNLDDTVTFSATATTNLEAGAVSLNITEGDKLTVRQCLYALLLKSANEVANGLAEHVAGSNAAFAKMMNDKAKALGCTNTNFVNPHGLNNSNHYTTARDMALIARAAFQNETLRKIDTTLSYELPATQKAGARMITMGHKMMYSTDSRYYPGIIGGKTGYTSLAGNTLVTAVEKDGVRLIAVILKSKSTHYADTKALLDYGFAVMKGGTGPSDVSSVPSAGWVQDGAGWYYIKTDGSRASNEWQNIDQKYYWFDSDAYMAAGWRQFSNGAWYYFKSSGAMATNCWIENHNQWFYLGADGVMLTNTTTPDGYQVDGNGVWVE